MFDLLRYTAARCSLSQVWAPPWIAFVLIIAVSYPSGAAASGSVSLGVVILLMVATWIGLATINSESASQRASLAAQQGGAVRYRVAELLSAALASIVLTPLSIGFALINDPARPSAAQLTVAVLAHLIAAMTGVTLSALISRPLINRAGYALLLSVGLLVVLIAVPGLPPVRQVVDVLQAPHPYPQDLRQTTMTAIGTVMSAALVWWASAALAHRKA